MGKSTTAQMFVDEGCALWDADAAVHRLYAKGGAAVPLIENVFPTAIENGSVSRPRLKEIITEDSTALKQIETIVHPLVGKDRLQFIGAATADIIVLDIPLLFETGGEGKVDAIACVWVDDVIQKTRVLERGTMTLEHYETIRAKQMPAAEKCARADYVIETDTIEHARQQVHSVVQAIRENLRNA